MRRNDSRRVDPCNGEYVAVDEWDHAGFTIQNTRRLSLFNTDSSDD
jgi:hypothetical protein